MGSRRTSRRTHQEVYAGCKDNPLLGLTAAYIARIYRQTPGFDDHPSAVRNALKQLVNLELQQDPPPRPGNVSIFGRGKIIESTPDHLTLIRSNS
jgi:hypothetical protein